jgi:preprotein translocase subunit YajC
MQLAAHLATVVATAEEDGGGNLLISLLPFLAIGGIMYFLLIRPQRQRARKQAEMQKAIGVGDEVITTSGIYGFIKGEDGPNRFWLEIDSIGKEPVMMRISRAAVSQRVDTDAEDDVATTDDHGEIGDAADADAAPDAGVEDATGRDAANDDDKS